MNPLDAPCTFEDVARLCQLSDRALSRIMQAHHVSARGLTWRTVQQVIGARNLTLLQAADHLYSPQQLAHIVGQQTYSMIRAILVRPEVDCIRLPTPTGRVKLHFTYDQLVAFTQPLLSVDSPEAARRWVTHRLRHHTPLVDDLELARMFELPFRVMHRLRMDGRLVAITVRTKRDPDAWRYDPSFLLRRSR